MKPRSHPLWWSLGVAVIVIFGMALAQYLRLPQPRHIWPRSADEWTAWGTWLGSLFTGGALLFTGSQFRRQSSELQAQAKTLGDEREAAKQRRLALAQAFIWRVESQPLVLPSAQLCAVPPGNGPADWKLVSGLRITVQVTAPASRPVSNLQVHLPSSIFCAPVPSTNEDARHLAQLETAYPGSPDETAIVVAEEPRMDWVDRTRPGGLSPSGVYLRPFHTSPARMNGGRTRISLPGIKPGETAHLTYYAPLGEDQGLRLTFADDDGYRFEIDQDGIAQPYSDQIGP